MAFTFKPAVWDGATLYELPRPVLSVRLQDGWDFEQFKVPLADGDFAAGHSRNGVDIAIEGQVGTQGGALRASEQAMFEEVERLRAALHVGGAEGKYWLFLYHDAGSGTYRHLRGCSTVRFECDVSDPHLFSYSLVVHAEDPTVYATGPV